MWRYVAADLDPDGLHEGAGHHRVLSDAFAVLALSTGAALILSAWDAYRTAKRIRVEMTGKKW